MKPHARSGDLSSGHCSVEAEFGFGFADEPVDGLLFDAKWDELTI
jgi:hypothetical protein